LLNVILIVVVLLVGWRLSRTLRRRLLWRVRRKLTLSYIFIGFVPAILIIVFFLLCGLLLFLNAGAYMLRSRVAGVIDAAQLMARSAADALQDVTGEDAGPILEAERHAAGVQYPGALVALVPDVPAWVPPQGFGGLVTNADGRTGLVARAAARVGPGQDGQSRAVIVDIPLGAAFERRLRDESGFEMGGTGGTQASSNRLEWVAFLQQTTWADGHTATTVVPFRMDLGRVYDQITGGSLAQLGTFNVGQLLLIVVAAVGGSFLVIQIVAFVMGLGLARSITGSIHELFEGTEKVREGDFAHRITIRTRDQLGQLAESFNSMTASMEDLLRQKAEKERLEQELQTARNIQMSLLPQGPLSVPGLAIAALCEPAREVGGDYYDVLPIDEHRIGVLIADVAGKGTFAALYMAELKGVMLSLSRLHRSPRALLVDANRILAQHLDTRSFITMSYGVFDLENRTLTHARAGHCPLLYVPGTASSSRVVRTLSPQGLVLGLKLDNGEKFNELLQEETIPLSDGDLFVLYTDGIIDAANAAGDPFGDLRLVTLVQEHADLPLEVLRERVVREIQAFAGTAPQQDDMTMVLIRIEKP